MFRRALVLLALLVPAAGLAAPSDAPAPVAPPAPAALPRTLRVTGEGRTTAAPDVALVTVGVEATGKTLAATTADATERMRRVLATLERAGVARRDVQTARYDVAIERPWKDGKPGPISGYTVTNQARVKVREVPKLGRILDEVIGAGSNVVQSLAFVKDDPAPDQARALAAAVASARAKADVLAKAAGVAVGEVMSMSESVRAPGPIPYGVMRSMAAERADVPVAPGELEITADVEVVFGIR